MSLFRRRSSPKFLTVAAVLVDFNQKMQDLDKVVEHQEMQAVALHEQMRLAQQKAIDAQAEASLARHAMRSIGAIISPIEAQRMSLSELKEECK